MDVPSFDIVTYRTVYDTEPAPEVVDLPTLVAALRTFEVKADVADKVRRELARVARARDVLLAGGPAEGPIGLRLSAARDEAAAAGGDAAAAVRHEADRIDDETRKDAKKSLRLWAAARVRPGARRGSDAVLAVSCLVLDYDTPVGPEEVGMTWAPWFHVVHSTWSHTPDRPRLRVILPFARPVLPDGWGALWQWAFDLSGGTIDVALRSPGAPFALPAVADTSAPRVSRVSPGPLLDAELEGLPVRTVDPPQAQTSPSASVFARTDARRTVILGE